MEAKMFCTAEGPTLAAPGLKVQPIGTLPRFGLPKYFESVTQFPSVNCKLSPSDIKNVTVCTESVVLFTAGEGLLTFSDELLGVLVRAARFLFQSEA
jgi:hypothetical protein